MAQKKDRKINLFCFFIYKWVKKIIMKKNEDIILNRAKEYYINNKDIILNRAKECYINNKESIKDHYEKKTKI